MLNRKAQGSLSGGSYGGTVVLIVLLGFILFYIVVVPTEYKEDLNLTPTPNFNSVVLQEYPSRLYIGDDEDIRTKISTLPIEKVTVDSTPMQDSTLLLTQGIVRKSVLSEDILTFDFNIDNLNDVYKTYLNLNVIDKENAGSVILILNDVKIYSGEARNNENLNIVLPSHYLKEANTIKISVSSPGFLFWRTNSYVFSDIYLLEEKYSRSNSKVTRLIILDSKDLADSESIKFSAYPKRLSSFDKPLKIEINGNLIYSGIPSSGSGMEVEVPREYLRSGTNSISFEVERDGSYELLYMDLALKKVEFTEENIAEYKFVMGSSEWKKVKDSRYECELFISKSGGDNSLNIELNNHVLRYSFDDNNEIKKDVCEYLEEDDNEIKLIPDNEVYLNIIRITIKDK